jgi:hypothetical protein
VSNEYHANGGAVTQALLINPFLEETINLLALDGRGSKLDGRYYKLYKQLLQ